MTSRCRSGPPRSAGNWRGVKLSGLSKRGGRKISLLATALLAAGTLSAGTLIYRTRNREEKVVSDVTIVSIDSRIMTIKIAGGTETIPLANVVKYYDTDIKAGGEFEDNTAEYDVILGSEDCPKTGYTGGKTKKTTVFSIPYTVRTKGAARSDAACREPYFYLFVLTSGAGGSRTLHSYASPARARVSMKTYDEAKMLEKVISLDRPTYYPADRNRLGRAGGNSTVSLGGEQTATFTLNGVKDRQIIGWYLVVWGKTRIAAVKEWHDTGYSLPAHWWLR